MSYDYRRVRFQNEVATNGITLPVAAIIATLLGLMGGDFSPIMLAGYVLGAAITYLLVELNNKNALLRIRSRLTTSIFLLYLGVCPFLHPLQTGGVVTLCVLVAYHLLFHSYQTRLATGQTFYAFCAIGVGSLVFPQLLYLLPFYYWSMAMHLRTLGMRTLLASLLGLMLPYWFLLGYAILTGEATGMTQHFMQLAAFAPVDWQHPASIWRNLIQLGQMQMVSLCALAWIAIISIIHYKRTSYNDKIRVRMFFSFLIVQEGALALLLVLQPQHFNTLFYVLIMNSSPLIAHFFALTNRWLTNATFILFLIIMAATAVYNLWMPFPIF